MGWLYLPKTTPTAGQKGFVCGDVFVPIDIQTPSVNKKGICIEMPKNLPSEDGLIFHFTGESSTAETGQIPKEEGSSVKYAQTIDGIPCVTFPTNSDFLKYDDIGLIGSFDTTVSAWVYFPQTPSNSWVMIVGWGRRTESIPPTEKSANNDIGFMNAEGANLLNLRYKAGWSCGSQTLLETIQTGEWYHLVMTVEKTTKTARAFLNGEFVGSKSFDEFDIESSEFVLNFNIGHVDNSGNNACSLAGVRVYNRVLSDPELDALNNEFFGGKAFIPLEEVQPEEGAEFEKNSEEMPSEGLILNVPLAQSATADELGNELSETGNVAFTTIEGIQCADISDTSAAGGTHIVINAPALSSSGAVPVSFSFWAFAHEIPLSKDEFFYYGRRNENNDPDYESIFVGISKNNRFVTNFGESNSNAYPGFHHIAYVCTGTKTLFYVDGVLQFSDNRVWDYGGNTPISLSNGYFAGFRIYNRALSETEIRKLSREWQKPVPNPEANTSGILINSKNEIAFLKKTSAEMPVDGLVLNFPCTSSTAETGQQFQAKNVELKKRDDSAYFPGEKSGIISTVSASELLASATSAISFSAWFNTSDTGKAQEIISCTETGGFSVGLNSDSNSGYCHIYLRAGSSYANYNAFEISGNILKNTWYFICVIYNGSNIKTYLNSTLKNTQSKTGTLAYPANDTPLTIGAEAEASGGVSTDTFQGYIAGVRIYNRALTEEEVATLNTEFSVQKINKIFIPIIGENNAGA